MEKEHFEILLEDIKEKVNLILEGHAALDRKIDRVQQSLEEKIEDNSLKIEALDRKIDQVDARLSRRIDEMGETLSRKIDGVAADLAAHRTDTESHPKGYKASE